MVIEAEALEQTHPAYPAGSKEKGASTWRRKECHGWDYKSKNGAYTKGSHATGIEGVRGVVGMDPEKTHAIIMDEIHGFTVANSAVAKLAQFLGRGQIDTNRYIDRKSKVVRGKPRRGAQFFQTIGAVCVVGCQTAGLGSKDLSVARGSPWSDLTTCEASFPHS